jgi:protein ImuA
MDAALGGGLALGALHSIEGAGIEAETSAAPTAFLATLLARLPGHRKILWIAQFDRVPSRGVATALLSSIGCSVRLPGTAAQR